MAEGRMYNIGLSRPEELPLLPEIERRASDLFLAFPFTADIPADPTPVAEFEAAHRAGLLWIARTGADEPVGFALVQDLGAHLHLEELDVLPEHGRLGLGTRLVREVLSFARSRRQPVTLTTFRDIPFNAPFYARLGFRVLPPEEWSRPLADCMLAEAARGLTPEMRVAMCYEVGGPVLPERST